jgi:predicted thioesterase
MKKEMKVGLKREDKRTVRPVDTAESMGSGDLPVYATPSLVAFLEYSSKELLRDYLGENETTVGIRMDVSHLRASRIGRDIISRAEIVSIEGKKITLKVDAYDGNTLIGTGEHERFIVDKTRFMNKLD